GGGKRLERGLQVRGQPAQAPQFFLVGGKFGLVRQLAMDEKVRDLLEFAGVGDVEDVVAAIVQVVAAAADRAQGGVARHHARQGDGLLGLGGGGCGLGFFCRACGHVSTPEKVVYLPLPCWNRASSRDSNSW